MCGYGSFAQPSGNCSDKIISYCNVCGMDCCTECYSIGQQHYEGLCPCGKGMFVLAGI